MNSTTANKLSSRMIYSNLAVDARFCDIKLTCLEAIRTGIPRILVNAVNVSLAAEICAGSSVKVCAALSYPIGAYPPEIKGLEIEDALSNGADEIVMLMALGAFLDGFLDVIEEEMVTLIDTAKDKPSHYMIEASALNEGQLLNLCRLAENSGIGSIIASTNFKQGGYPPATVEQISYLVTCSHTKMNILAYDNIKCASRAVEFLNTGASMICTPDAMEIIKEVNRQEIRP